MVSSSPESQAEFLERMRQQYDFGPYPRIPIDKIPGEDSNDLFIHNLVTPFYLRDRKVINSEGKIILEAGCGTGYKALTLAKANPGAKVIGIDISPKSVDLARQRAQYHGYQDRVEFHILEIEHLPQLGVQFDYINCDEVLYFSPDIVTTLAALKTALKISGIIRANLHSSLQRQVFFRAQEFFTLLGLMDADAEEMAIPIAIEIMKSLNASVDLKLRGWAERCEEIEDGNKNQYLLSNHLMKEDKGYRISDLFAALDRSSLDFISMTNWRHWNLSDLFLEPDNLPTYLAMGLANSSVETQLTIYEILHPAHRLFDFWCCHPQQESISSPVLEWTIPDWLKAKITLHPQLRTESFRESALKAVTNNDSLTISTFLSLPTLSPVTISYDVAALLLQLWDEPRPFTALVNFWQRIHPINLITLEPITPASAAQQVADALGKLEVFLYVLPEQIDLC